jgi:hypothetical protein
MRYKEIVCIIIKDCRNYQKIFKFRGLNMIKLIVPLLASVLLIACTSTSKNSESSPPQKEQKLSTEFTDEGIKITYTLFGNLDKIEVFGQADVWRGNVEALAEADAMAKLTKFVYGNDVSTSRRVKVIGLSIEAAKDNKLTAYNNKEGDIEVTDKQIEGLSLSTGLNAKTNNASSAERQAAALNATIVTTITDITAKGRLVGVRKVRDFQRNDGKVYVATYMWSKDNQAASEYIKNRIQYKQ